MTGVLQEKRSVPATPAATQDASKKPRVTQPQQPPYRPPAGRGRVGKENVRSLMDDRARAVLRERGQEDDAPPQQRVSAVTGGSYGAKVLRAAEEKRQKEEEMKQKERRAEEIRRATAKASAAKAPAGRASDPLDDDIEDPDSPEHRGSAGAIPPGNFYSKRETRVGGGAWDRKRSSVSPEGGASSFGSGVATRASIRKGFENLGNTCYINATLQCLTSLAPFVQSLLSRPLAKRAAASPGAYRAFLCILAQVQQGERRTISARELKAAIAGQLERFRGNAQQDAHEFLAVLLEQLHSEAAPFDEEAGPRPRAPSPEGPEAAVSGADGREPQRSARCPTRVNFECEVSHGFECEAGACGARASLAELYRDFSLDIPEAPAPSPSPSSSSSSSSSAPASSALAPARPSLSSLLRRFFAAEGGVERTCEACGHRSARVEHRLRRLPRVLVLHLKRFKFVLSRRSHDKRADPVEIDATLDLGFACEEGWTEGAPALRGRARASASFAAQEGGAGSVGERTPPNSSSAGAPSPSFVDLERPEGSPAPAPAPPPAAPPPRRPAPSATPTPPSSCAPAPAPCPHARAPRGEPARSEDEDVDLRKAIELSLAEAAPQNNEAEEDEELRRAIRLSLQEGAAQGGPARAREEERTPPGPARRGGKEEAGAGGALPESLEAVLEEEAGGAGAAGPLETRYRLHSIISHVGSSAAAGHYICDVHDGASGRWLNLNDASVREVAAAEVFGERRQAAGYIFFYVNEACRPGPAPGPPRP
eukprot:tig00001264_g7866.t1